MHLTSTSRRETRTAEQIFAELSAKIVANSKELYDYDYPDFWTMPAFAKGDKPGRRDVLRSLADQAAPTLGAIDIVVTTVGPDMAVLVESDLGKGQYTEVLVVEAPLEARLDRLQQQEGALVELLVGSLRAGREAPAP